MGALQPWHLIVILVIVLMVFGPGKLPQVGRAVGEGLRELKGAASGGESKEAEGGTTHQSSTQPTAAAAPGSRCTSCGGAITAADKFCGTCGVKLNGEPAPTANNKTPVA